MTYTTSATLSIPCETSTREVDVLVAYDADLPTEACVVVEVERDPANLLNPVDGWVLYLPTPGVVRLEADAGMRTALRELGWSVL